MTMSGREELVEAVASTAHVDEKTATVAIDQLRETPQLQASMQKPHLGEEEIRELLPMVLDEAHAALRSAREKASAKDPLVISVSESVAVSDSVVLRYQALEQVYTGLQESLRAEASTGGRTSEAAAPPQEPDASGEAPVVASPGAEAEDHEKTVISEAAVIEERKGRIRAPSLKSVLRLAGLRDHPAKPEVARSRRRH
jgi:hypothetical protein